MTDRIAQALRDDPRITELVTPERIFSHTPGEHEDAPTAPDLLAYFHERGWSIHVDDLGTQSGSPFDDLARFVAERRPFSDRSGTPRRRGDRP